MDMMTNTENRAAQCPEHGDYESRRVTLMGRPMPWSGCPECDRIEGEQRDRERVAAEKRESHMRFLSRVNAAAIPARFKDRSFASFVADSEGKRTALKAAESFASSFDERRKEGATMVFSGLPGTGKSHLAIAVCLAVMEVGATAQYLNALDAIRLVRSTWARGSEQSETEVMRGLARVDLLVIDEVGAQYGSEGEQVILFDIINRRYQDLMPMILLTNQGKDGFRQYLGDRAFDRLREAGKWVAFDWESHRGVK